MNKLLLTLRFYATGGFLITVGDYMRVSKSSASNIIKNVSEALASLAPRYIRMPSNENEIALKHLQFYNKASLPRVIGSLDCTHIKIQSPGNLHYQNGVDISN